jgi:hypothetical protein
VLRQGCVCDISTPRLNFECRLGRGR